MAMSIQERQRRNECILRIRQLQDKKNQQNGGLSLIDDIKLTNLQNDANENGWVYW